MNYVSLSQSENIQDSNMSKNSLDTVGILTDKQVVKSKMKVKEIKNQLTQKAKQSKKHLNKFRKSIYEKCIQNNPRASMIVHFVTNAPKDPSHVIYLSLIMSSIGYLFPFNCMISITDYYKQSFCNNHIIYSITVTYIFTAVSTVILNNFFVKFVHFSKRILFGYFVSITVLTSLTLFVIWANILTDYAAYNSIIIVSAFTAFSCGIQQSSYYGYASLLPKKYIQALMIGESLSGVIATILRIITSSVHVETRTSATIYFILSITILVGCMTIFYRSLKSNFVQYHLRSNELYSMNYHSSTINVTSEQNTQAESNLKQTTNDEPPNLEEDSSSIEDNGELNLGFIDPAMNHSGFESSEFDPSESSITSLGNSRSSSRSSLNQVPNASLLNRHSFGVRLARFIQNSGLYESLRLRIQIIRHIGVYLLCIYLAYFITLSIFPSVILDYRLSHWNKIFPLIVLASFNTCELFGKLLASLVCKGLTKHMLLSVCVLRSVLVVCVVLLVAHSTQVSASTMHSALVMHATNYVFVVSVGLVGLTNGFCGCRPILDAHRDVRTADKEVAGNLMTTVLNLGLCCGVMVSLDIERRYIITTSSAMSQQLTKYQLNSTTILLDMWLTNGSVICH